MFNLVRNFAAESAGVFSAQRVTQQQLDWEDLKALILLQSLTKTYIPWTSSAIRPAALAFILNDILINDRKTIVELGGGVTTLFVSTLLSRLGQDRKLITIEHNQDWIEALLRNLSLFAHPENVELVHAELGKCERALDQNPWYDFAQIEQAIRGVKINLLIIDGPPAFAPGKSLSRYPAIPLLFDSLAERCSIFLDDGNRPGEKKIARLWEKEYGLKFQKMSGNTLMATRGPAWNIH